MVVDLAKGIINGKGNAAQIFIRYGLS